MYIIAKQASIPIEHTPVYGYHPHLSFYKLSSTIKWNLPYQARQRSSVQVDQLKEGCMHSQHKHRKKNFKHFFFTYLWPFFNYVFLLPIWKCTVKLAGLIEVKFSGSSKGWIWGLFLKFCPDLTLMADFRGRLRPKMARKIRNTYIGCTFSKWQ